MMQKTALEKILATISFIKPFDATEKEHISETIDWLKSGEPIFRISKPDNPNKHLVAYSVLLDKDAKKLLLVDHKNSGFWIPPGGHVEIDENPKETAHRECLEELGIKAAFLIDEPIFLASTATVGLTAGHTDVDLWYILNGNHETTYKFDGKEFDSVRWFDFDKIPYEKSDPHMRRFVKKLQHMLQIRTSLDAE